MIVNEMMFGSQLPRTGSEAEPKAKAGTPPIRVAISVAVAVGAIVGPVVGPVTVTVAVIGPVIRAIAVAVAAVAITDILYRAGLLSKCQRESAGLSGGWRRCGDHCNGHTRKTEEGQIEG